jgi:MoaA/NifB/PqqE/SkfB family radical SAM enzyme
MRINLPSTICFRVTRNCNARCGFCLAPPEGVQPDETTLIKRIDWLFSHGVETFHFCGGEPTVHPALPELLTHVHAMQGKSRLTTNAISISEDLISTLVGTGTLVKVSLHGDRRHHDEMVGRRAFDRTTRNLSRLIAGGARVSVQTTVVASQTWVVDRMVEFCIQARVRRLSFLPFVPRGSGSALRREYGLSATEREALRKRIKTKRRLLGRLLDVRWLDFNAQPLHVVEADGRIVLEGATESVDEVIARIPA